MNMKSILSKLSEFICIIAAASILPISAGAQVQINTKKMKISDFTQKTTKVVLSDDPFFDAALKDEISARWRISPYEFCTAEEFEQIKKDDSYYFLIPVKGQFRNEEEPGILYLTLVKGGAKAEGGIGNMLEIITIPIASADSPSGREIVVLPAFIDILQNYTLTSMESDLNAYTGLVSYVTSLSKSKGKNIIFAIGDLEAQTDEDFCLNTFDEDMDYIDTDDADDYITNNTENVIVSYVVAPANPVPGSYCYKFLIEPATHQLYFYKKHKISKKTGAGFLQEDIKRIVLSRK